MTDRAKLAALLANVAKQGHALVDQELELGLRSLAVPLYDRGGIVVAALNISAPAARGSSESIRKSLLPPLQESAARIEQDLGEH